MPVYSRRQWLTTVGSVALLPHLSARAAEKEVRGAFIIMSTPYTTSNKVDFDALAYQVDFLDPVSYTHLTLPTTPYV